MIRAGGAACPRTPWAPDDSDPLRRSYGISPVLIPSSAWSRDLSGSADRRVEPVDPHDAWVADRLGRPGWDERETEASLTVLVDDMRQHRPTSVRRGRTCAESRRGGTTWSAAPQACSCGWFGSRAI